MQRAMTREVGVTSSHLDSVISPKLDAEHAGLIHLKVLPSNDFTNLSWMVREARKVPNV